MLNSIKKSLFYKILRSLKNLIFDINTQGYVLMLHRVNFHKANGLKMNENMKITPNFLEDFIAKTKSKYNFISLSEIDSYIKAKNKKKFIAFTMDDGYKDNYEIAYPIFKKHNIPFAIFVASDYPNKKCCLWWHWLEDIINEHSQISTFSNGKFMCSTVSEKEETFFTLRSLILKMNQDSIILELKKEFPDYNIDFEKYNEDYCINWNQIQELKKDPLVTIGGHTAHHFNLHNLSSDGAVMAEINSGIEEISKNLNGYRVEFFAYPFGSPLEIGKREIGCVKKMNLKGAFLGYGRGVKVKSNYCAYPRIALTENFDFGILK